MAFTAIDGDTSWQDLAIAEELAESYNLRRSLCGLSTVSAPTQASKVFDFVQALQDGIEEMANDLWVNSSGTLASLEGQSAYPATMTLSQAMTAAGLTASGYWRRIAEGGTQPATWTNYAAAGWSYGKITSKDLAGPWLFKDLQLALSALTRAKLPYTQYRRKTFSAGYWAATMPSAALSWGSWETSSVIPQYEPIKNKDYSGAVVYVAFSCEIMEFRFDISSTLAGYVSASLMLTRAYQYENEYVDWEPYADYAGKVDYANLTVDDVTASLGETVGNASTASTSGGTTSYAGVIAEDADNVIPLFNDIFPDANVPANTSILIGLEFDQPILLLDFTFE